MSSALLTSDLVKKAVTMVAPAIELAMDSKLVKRRAFHIVILDPTVPYADGQELPILHECSFGDAVWEFPFKEYAHAKARFSWRTGLPSSEAQRCPHLCQKGDIKYPGSVVHNGLIVAGSGVEGYFDQMFSGMTAVTCEGLTMHAMAPIVGDGKRAYV